VGRSFLLGLVLGAVLLLLPGQARAAISLTPCPGATDGLQCGTVVVPLDRTGVVAGSVSLHVEVLPASGVPRGTMFLIAGGPGQGSAHSYGLGNSDTAEFMQAMLPGYTLVAFDNRGTGDSGLIDCPVLQATATATAEQGAVLARDCAGIIGPTRQFYATRDHAEDTDAVRAALGVQKIALFGVSYGTKLALAYALAHPGNVERLLLDSVVPTQFPDPFDRNVLREMPDTLASFCQNGTCRGATTNFAGEVVTLANRIEAKPISGRIIAPNGKLKTIRLNGEELLSMLIDTDLSPGLAAEAPAAVHAALRGNVRPLLRIYDMDLLTGELKAADLSFGLNAATNCADGLFPWDPSAPPSSRQAAIDAAVNASPSGAFGPFGKWSARMGTAYYCEQWPSPSGRTPLGRGPLPNVPVLAVNGGYDLRTPVANAVSVVSQFPQGRLIVVPGVGHSVLTADFSYCSQRAVRAWILGQLSAPQQAACPRVQPLVKVVGTFPAKPAKPTAKGTQIIAGKTVREAEATFLQLLFSSTEFTPRGVYGGKLAMSKNGDSFTLTKYALAPGVLVSGKITFVDIGPPSTYKGTFKVSGPGAVAGTLTITAKGTIAGKLGGSRVSGRY
jgi:pimeloyl-ACP methyl ester carboxylesterase